MINIASGGNYWDDQISPPGDYPQTIAMGARNLDGWPIGNTGPWIDFAAQGVGIVALEPWTDTSIVTNFGGSSAASAEGSGLAALLVSHAKVRGDTLDMDDVKGIFGLADRTGVPQLDSSFKLISRPASHKRFNLADRTWFESTETLSTLMNGINGCSYGVYIGTRHTCSTYVAYSDLEDYYAVHGAWANGPRSIGAMNSGIIVPAKTAEVAHSDAGGVWLKTTYWTNIVDLAGDPVGNYPVSSASQLEVTVSVAGEKRLTTVNAASDYQDGDETFVSYVPHQENNLRMKCQLAVGSGPWEDAAVYSYTEPAIFTVDNLQGSQWYHTRFAPETDLQVGVTGPGYGNMVKIRTPPNVATNLNVAVVSQYGPKTTPTGTKTGITPLAAAAIPEGPSNLLRVSADPPLNQAESINGYLVVTHHWGDSHLVIMPPYTYVRPDVAYDTVWGADPFSDLVCVPLNEETYEVWVEAFDDYKNSKKGTSSFVTTGEVWNRECGGRVDPHNVPDALKKEEGAPYVFNMTANYPNPFNAGTTINFSLPEDAETSLKVYNVLGQEVATLVEGFLPAGEHTIDWNAARMASGMYLYRLTSGQNIATRKMTLLK